ncbi:polyprenyl synthetase family protein [Jatrophihabitans sp.]|uniref:polyprenyl synthetase family protein n=1 Tax=Jatrophihabitans sp. TaxID=1932789 RepID=UPI002CD8C96F|nr:polyprenyl synthetase family protein [Jatrophihabitans sp.]
MSATVADPDPTSLGPPAPRTDRPVPVADRVEAELAAFLDQRTAQLTGISADLSVLAEVARAAVLNGGKRLRPTFAYWGWRCVSPAGAAGEDELVRAAAGLELLHACALVHDDMMDASDTRRGQPAAHVRFGRFLGEQGWAGNARSFGAAGAILLGDLLLSWSEELFTAAIGCLPSDRARAATAQFGQMRTEVVAGQFLDMLAQSRGAFDPAEALRVIEFKTSKYTVQRPLLVGAAAAGGSPELISVLSDYGVLVGEAFQLRDDLLGVFGDPTRTGKPAGDDLREGKRTLLVALAYQQADPAQRELLRAGIGDPQLSGTGVDRLREVLTATGAHQQVEQRILARAGEAIRRLADGRLQPDAAQALTALARAASHRTS